MLPWDTIMLMLSFIIQEGLWGELMDSALALVSRVFTRAIRKSRAEDNADDLLDDIESAESTTEIPSSSSEASNYGGPPSSAGSSAPLQSQATYKSGPHNFIKFANWLPPEHPKEGVLLFTYVQRCCLELQEGSRGTHPNESLLCRRVHRLRARIRPATASPTNF